MELQRQDRGVVAESQRLGGGRVEQLEIEAGGLPSQGGGRGMDDDLAWLTDAGFGDRPGRAAERDALDRVCRRLDQRRDGQPRDHAMARLEAGRDRQLRAMALSPGETVLRRAPSVAEIALQARNMREVQRTAGGDRGVAARKARAGQGRGLPLRQHLTQHRDDVCPRMVDFVGRDPATAHQRLGRALTEVGDVLVHPQQGLGRERFAGHLLGLQGFEAVAQGPWIFLRQLDIDEGPGAQVARHPRQDLERLRRVLENVGAQQEIGARRQAVQIDALLFVIVLDHHDLGVWKRVATGDPLPASIVDDKAGQITEIGQKGLVEVRSSRPRLAFEIALLVVVAGLVNGPQAHIFLAHIVVIDQVQLVLIEERREEHVFTGVAEVRAHLDLGRHPTSRHQEGGRVGRQGSAHLRSAHGARRRFSHFGTLASAA